MFRNRKGLFSINVQTICDADRVITNIFARIFDNSVIRDKFENGEDDGLLLGDDGYLCRSYLMTPLLNPSTTAERRYNHAHICSRSRIEQTFEVLKMRFRALRIPLRTKLETSLQIIIAVACLHNFAVKSRLPLPDEQQIVQQDDDSSRPAISMPAATLSGNAPPNYYRKILVLKM